MTPSKLGGKRAGSGRKKLPDGEGKVTFTTYPRSKFLTVFDDEEAARVWTVAKLEEYFNRKKPKPNKLSSL